MKDSLIRQRQAGFTLTEVMLVLVVGAILLGSSLALYNQMRNNSGHTNAWQRVLALQTTVEDIAVAKNGTYPTIDELRTVWKARRPSDYATSPWGGPAMGGAPASESKDGIRGNQRAADDYSDDKTNVGDSGILYYYYLAPNELDGYLTFADLAKGGDKTQIRFYMVSIADSNGDRYYYVNGFQPKTGGQVEGEVGE
ncbi:hypothetical protein D3C87_931150 [compost metagenome]